MHLSFARLLALEARGAIRPLHWTMLGLLALLGALVAAWLPAWPESVYRFFDRVLNLHGWPEVIFGNNLIAIFFMAFWFGLFDLLRVYILPLEGDYLDLLLSKPVRRRSYMLARLLPSFAVLTGFAAIGAAVHYAAMLAVGQAYDLAAYLGVVGAVLGFVLLMLAVANLALLQLRDSFSALLVGFAVFMACFVPSLVYLYRPDVYAAAPWLADLLVFPVNLIWHPGIAAAWGGWIGLGFAAIALLLVWLAGLRFERRDLA